MLFLPSGGGINFSENGGCKITDYTSQLAAAAAHSAAVVDIEVIAGGSGIRCYNQSRCQRAYCYLPIGVTRIYRDLRQYLPSGCFTPYSAIRDFETIYYSRLRRN